MLFVLADDFSGAAEIGGIGHRYGLHTEIQLNLDIGSTADLVVLDTDTRSLTEGEATAKMLEIATALKKWHKPFSLFKKIDSVMRGHLIPELNVLQECFRFNRILLMPGNPARGRKIIGGEYFIDGVRLHETVFASDPDFPVLSSNIDARVASHTSTLKHVHVSTTDALPSDSLVTGNIESKVDLKNYLIRTGKTDLCCGAAELFESYLEHLGFSQQSKSSDIELRKSEYTLIINGSTVKNQRERKGFDRLGIAHHSLPDNFKELEFQSTDEAIIKWFQQILTSLLTHKVAVVTIDHPVQHNKILSEKFLKYFVKLMEYITRDIALSRIHFCLTGGATASALIRPFAEGKLFVKEEIAPGVVSLVMGMSGIQYGCFTVKPGSYAWPPLLIESISG